MVRVIVDSSCDLPDELLEEYEIKSVSQRVYINNREYLDKVTINAKEVYEAMKKGIIPQTSLPRPMAVSYTHLRAHETVLDLVCRLLLEKKNKTHTQQSHLVHNTQLISTQTI